MHGEAVEKKSENPF